MLTAFDYAVIAVIGLSALRGLWRGLVSELFGLVGYVLAFVAAKRYAEPLATFIPTDWPGGRLTQVLIAFAVIFVVVLVASSALDALLRHLTDAAGLQSVDRSLGMLFGVLRGTLLVLVLVAVAGLTELPRHEFWRNALLRPYAEQGVRALKPFLPERLAAYVRF